MLIFCVKLCYSYFAVNVINIINVTLYAFWLLLFVEFLQFALLWNGKPFLSNIASNWIIEECFRFCFDHVSPVFLMYLISCSTFSLVVMTSWANQTLSVLTKQRPFLCPFLRNWLDHILCLCLPLLMGRFEFVSWSQLFIKQF